MNSTYLLEFFKAAGVTTTLVLPIVLGLVTWYGKLGVSGKNQLYSSMATGLLIGGFVMYVQVSPVTLIQWTAVVLYGLILGLMASGVYDTGKAVALKINQH